MAFRKADLLLPLCLVSAILLNVYAAVDPTGVYQRYLEKLAPMTPPVAAMAKCFATDTAMRVATDAVQLFGAAGISADVPINRYFRDAKVLQIIEGTNQIQRNIIGDSLLGRAAR